MATPTFVTVTPDKIILDSDRYEEDVAITCDASTAAIDITADQLTAVKFIESVTGAPCTISADARTAHITGLALSSVTNLRFRGRAGAGPA